MGQFKNAFSSCCTQSRCPVSGDKQGLVWLKLPATLARRSSVTREAISRSWGRAGAPLGREQDTHPPAVNKL